MPAKTGPQAQSDLRQFARATREMVEQDWGCTTWQGHYVSWPDVLVGTTALLNAASEKCGRAGLGAYVPTEVTVVGVQVEHAEDLLCFNVAGLSKTVWAKSACETFGCSFGRQGLTLPDALAFCLGCNLGIFMDAFGFLPDEGVTITKDGYIAACCRGAGTYIPGKAVQDELLGRGGSPDRDPDQSVSRDR